MAAVRLIEADRCPPGRGTFVEAAGRKLAVFHLTDPPGFAVIDNFCPHADGNLFAGELVGRIVTCPSHGWQFNVITGVSNHSEAARVNSYPVEVRNGVIYADLDAAS
ncbi:MAG TPA: Rieske 2Fe-2S domain-containing protein [Phycisphaerae bacterium]|nr:Rieske 2Fe-2S domain-containing protein [Phycisphaerae bacterium]